MTGTPSRLFGLALSSCMLLSTGCGRDGAKAITSGSFDTSVEVDEDAPIIEHVPIDSAQPISQDVRIEALVLDDLSAIDTVSVVYKRSDAADWSNDLLEEGDDDMWVGQIPGADVNGSNIFYYITAIDSSGNEGFFPVDGEANPIGFRVNPDG